jgi:hypothetical protein
MKGLVAMPTSATTLQASVVVIAHGTIDRYALGVTMMRGSAARHLSVDVTAHTSMAWAVRRPVRAEAGRESA